MEPDHIRFGGGAAETVLNPLVAIGMLIAIGLILSRPRDKAVTPFLIACLSIPITQVVVVGSLHFTVLRILIIAGLIKRAMHQASSEGKYPGGFNRVDRMVVLWTLSALIVLSVQWMDSTALIHNLGDFLDCLGAYLVLRFLVPDADAIRRLINALAAVCVIQGVCMTVEQIYHLNVFGYLGALWLNMTVRDGVIRSQGVMGCISAGVFGGVSIPLFLWLWKQGKPRLMAYSGLAGAMAMVITSHSSTSLLALGGSVLGLCLWPLRERMRLLRWGLTLGLVALHLTMRAPVWALIARVDLTGSSSSYHRYGLVDNCIRHFNQWWLLGYKYYNDWGWEMWDTCNQFVDVAVKGGLITLILYIGVFVCAFRAIGIARQRATGDLGQQWLLWCLGSALFATVTGQFGINYMAQLMLSLFSVLACISVATIETPHPVAASIPTPAEFAFVGPDDRAEVDQSFAEPRSETLQGLLLHRAISPESSPHSY